jgi:hypothetical protein
MRVVLTLPDREVAMSAGERVLGRDVTCDIVVDDRSVSRNHAAIVVSTHSVIVRDLGSKNGTWVNGMRLATDRRLRHGDRLGLGAVVLPVRIVAAPSEDGYDDGWLAIQAALLVKESSAGRTREADEILFRLAEAFEDRIASGDAFGVDVTDAALAAVIDYAAARARPGWTRWASAVHAKLALPPGPAVRRSLENVGEALRTSGTVTATTSISTRRRSA